MSFDQYAVDMIKTLHTPIAERFLYADDTINWQDIFENYKYLSYGEQAAIQFVCSITDHQCPDDGKFRTIRSWLGSTGEQSQEIMLNTFEWIAAHWEVGL